MPLSVLAGPANAGKVARLLERYLGALDSDPFLIVPNRPDVDRAERELLRGSGALMGGSIGTFDDLFRRIGRSERRPATCRNRCAAHAAAPARRRAAPGRRGSDAPRGSPASPTRSARRWPSSSRRCSSRPSWTASATTSSPSCTRPTERSSTGSASPTASSSGVVRQSVWPASSTPGTGARSSRTASRT